MFDVYGKEKQCSARYKTVALVRDKAKKISVVQHSNPMELTADR